VQVRVRAAGVDAATVEKAGVAVDQGSKIAYVVHHYFHLEKHADVEEGYLTFLVFVGIPTRLHGHLVNTVRLVAAVMVVV